LILYNGAYLPKEEVRISYQDRGYYFGDGVYEVFRIYDGEFYELDAHLHRLSLSAEGIRMDLPYTLDEISRMCHKLLEANRHVVNGTLYLQITRGIAPRSHVLPDHPTPTLLAYCQSVERPLRAMDQGVSAVTIADTRWLHCDLKTLNLLPNTLAKQHAVDQQADEAILHRDGMVTECSAANVMIVKNGQLYTHPANHLILHGITRAVILRLAHELGIPSHEQPFDLATLQTADEVFITGTTVELTPVVQIDHTAVSDGRPGPITRQLQQAFSGTIPKKQ